MKPNVIIVNPDQMRANSLAHLGNSAAYTPCLDSLCEDAVSFSNAFCQNPVCVPSRASFFTGLYPHTNGHRTMNNLLKMGDQCLFSDLKDAGYFTVSSTRGDLMAGQMTKYHKKLIDKYLTFSRPKKPLKPRKIDRGLPESDKFFSFDGGIIPTKNPDDLDLTLDDLIIDSAINFINNPPKNKPFFMFLGLFYPHPTYQIEKKYFDLIDKTKLKKRYPPIKEEDGKPLMERGLLDSLRVKDWDEERINTLRTIYLAMCAKVDDQIARLISALKSQGLYDNTVLLIFSDHGDYTGDFGLVEKAQNCFPDCLVNVPLIIKPQKNFTVNKGINNNLVELTDIVATISELSDTPIKRTHFSQSLVPTLKDKNIKHRDYVFCEGGRLIGEKHCMEYSQSSFDPLDHYAPRLLQQSKEDGSHTKAVMIRNHHYKYIKRLYEKDEFYDLLKGEAVNLIDQPEYAPIINEMKLKMLDWYMRTCDVVPQKLDERFPKEFMQNHITAVGVPKPISWFIVFLVNSFLKLIGKTQTELTETVRKRIEKKGKK